MTPEEHARLVQNMRLAMEARRALDGRVEDPGKALAALLRSDAPISPQVRQLLADFIDRQASRQGRPYAVIKWPDREKRKIQFEKRMAHLQRGLDFYAQDALSTEDFAEAARVSDRSLDRSCACARAFDQWRAEDMPWEFRSPEAVGAYDADDYDRFLREQFVDWLLENPDCDPTRKDGARKG